MRQSKILRTKLFGFATILLISVLLFIWFLRFPPLVLTELENRTWDWRLKLVASPEKANKSIKLIVVDQVSLDFFEKEYSLTWPLPRDAYRYVIDFLSQAGAKGIAFDILFTESSVQAVETDKEFAKATSSGLPIVTAVNLENYEKFVWPEKIELFRKRQEELDTKTSFTKTYLSDLSLSSFKSVTLPIPELLEQSPAFGAVQASPDSDGVFRQYLPGDLVFGIPVLSLPFSFYNLVTNGSSFPVADFLDQDKRLSIYPHGPSGTYEAYSLAAVIQAQAALKEGKNSSLNPEIFRDAWVILGVSAPGLMDLRPTSLESRGNGIELVAAVLDNIIGHSFVKHLPLNLILILNIIIVAGIVWSCLFITGVHWQALSSGFIIFSFLGLILFAAEKGYWIPFLGPAIIIIIAIILGLSFQYQLEGKQRRFIRSAFQYYLSPAVVEQVVIDPTQLSLGGEKRELSIFFSDIVGFTSISESLEANKLVILLNEYLTLFTDIIQASGGTVDKYIGDSVMAFWNAPLSIADHASCAVRTAVLCQRELLAKEQYFLKNFGVNIKTRIGINSDFVSVGNFGSNSRFNYTVVGDGVNLASRLEGANRFFGTSILVSESTYRLEGSNGEFRRVAKLRVIGKQKPIEIYEPFINENQKIFQGNFLAKFENAIKLFEAKDLIGAKQLFQELNSDPVSAAYVNRIESDLAKNSSAWSSVWNLSEK